MLDHFGHLAVCISGLDIAKHLVVLALECLVLDLRGGLVPRSWVCKYKMQLFKSVEAVI